MSSRPPCPSCGWTHCAGDVRALSRFTGVTGYMAGGQVYETREDAESGLCEQRQEARA